LTKIRLGITVKTGRLTEEIKAMKTTTKTLEKLREINSRFVKLGLGWGKRKYGIETESGQIEMAMTEAQAKKFLSR
jgi:hypothetical protein